MLDPQAVQAAAGAGGVPVLEWGRLDADGLKTAAAELQRSISALEHQQRQVLALIDDRKAYSTDGARDAADWAANTLGVDRRKANDAVQVGRQLQQLPRLADAAAAGELSADQAKPAATLAELDGEAAWAGQAPSLPPAVLQRTLARKRRPGSADHRAASAARHFSAWEAGQELRFRGSVPVDDGRRLLAAIERNRPPKDPHADTPESPGQRMADGLVALAGATLAADADPDRATVVLFAELAAVCDDDPAATAELEASQPVATDTARRLLCDSRRQVIVQDRDGIAVGCGTTQRTVSAAMRRALMARDMRCRFGNCTATAFLHAHHIVHWPSPTTMGNLVLLCWRHHHEVHEGGWTITGDPNGELIVRHPDGVTSLSSWPRHRPAVGSVIRLELGAPTATPPSPVPLTTGWPPEGSRPTTRHPSRRGSVTASPPSSGPATPAPTAGPPGDAELTLFSGASELAAPVDGAAATWMTRGAGASPMAGVPEADGSANGAGAPAGTEASDETRAIEMTDTAEATDGSETIGGPDTG